MLLDSVLPCVHDDLQAVQLHSVITSPRGDRKFVSCIREVHIYMHMHTQTDARKMDFAITHKTHRRTSFCSVARDIGAPQI